MSVPIRDGAGSRGLHHFTGLARSAAEALERVVAAYAVAAEEAELRSLVTARTYSLWSTAGYRPGWEPLWAEATVSEWHSDHH
ncbi:hypothetical protein [Streptomyces sp. NPDC051014]|uniref:hypothetical protein n=1 Tax=Streptomyces sp. NPDC051014 TaxID=3155751 RepID=UPI0033EBC339